MGIAKLPTGGSCAAPLLDFVVLLTWGYGVPPLYPLCMPLKVEEEPAAARTHRVPGANTPPAPLLATTGVPSDVDGPLDSGKSCASLGAVLLDCNEAAGENSPLSATKYPGEPEGDARDGRAPLKDREPSEPGPEGEAAACARLPDIPLSMRLAASDLVSDIILVLLLSSCRELSLLCLLYRWLVGFTDCRTERGEVRVDD